MTTLDIRPLHVAPRALAFEWSVDPASGLYRRTSARLQFPEGIDLTRLPPALPWAAALLCLHAHAIFLRPCRIRLPVRLPPGWRAFWERLIALEAYTADAMRGEEAAGPATLEDDGPPADLPAPARPPPGPDDRAASAFSGGKDSLLQAALLAEFTRRPLLVNVRSPMPPHRDQDTRRRREVLAEIVRRRDVELCEVESDFRSCWNNRWPAELGFGAAVNEVTDTHLYAAALLLAGAARGAPRLFLASEAEAQESADWEGRPVFHPHVMYAVVVQRALSRLIEPFGLRLGSLIAALPSERVQGLLARRHADLADLAYSCWSATDERAMCSACGKCLHVSFGALGQGLNAEAFGADWPRLLRFALDWRPKPVDGPERLRPLLESRRRLNGQCVRAVRTLTTPGFARLLRRARPGRWRERSFWAALYVYARLRYRFRRRAVEPSPGWWPEFLAFADPALREPMGRLYAETGPADATGRGAENADRARRASEEVAAALGGGTAREGIE